MLAFSGMRFGSGLRFRSSELFVGVNGFRLRIAISRRLPWASLCQMIGHLLVSSSAFRFMSKLMSTSHPVSASLLNGAEVIPQTLNPKKKL